MSTDISKPVPKSDKNPVKAAKKRPGTFGSPLRVILTTLIIFVASQVVIATIFTSLFLGTAGHGKSLDSSSPAQFIFFLFAEAGVVGMTYYALKWRGLGFGAIGLGRRPQWRDVGRAAIGFVIFYALIIVANLIVGHFVPSINNEQQDVGFNTISTVFDSILAFIALVLLPPIGEEILVRGYLYSGLRSTMRYLPALLVTSLLFGAAHLGENDSGLLWSGAMDTFLLSVVLVSLREKTGALYAGMLVHLANNLIAFGAHFH